MKKLKNKLKPVRQARGHLYDPNAPNDLMQPPEDWQFKKPLASGVIKGRGLKKPTWPKLNMGAILPREEICVNRIITLDEKVVKVAEMYNGGFTYKEMAETLGYKSPGAVSGLVEKARAAGLITQMRGSGNVKPSTRAVVDVDTFTARVQEKLAEVERLKQAATIAQALTELLGDAAADLLGQLYERVNA